SAPRVVSRLSSPSFFARSCAAEPSKTDGKSSGIAISIQPSPAARPRLTLARRLVKRAHARPLIPWIRPPVGRGGVSRKELGRRVAARLPHLLPQRDRCARVVACAGGELDADSVGLGLVLAGMRKIEGHVGNDARELLAEIADAEQRAADRDQAR